jgi:hypothetical protein
MSKDDREKYIIRAEEENKARTALLAVPANPLQQQQHLQQQQQHSQKRASDAGARPPTADQFNKAPHATALCAFQQKPPQKTEGKTKF